MEWSRTKKEKRTKTGDNLQFGTLSLNHQPSGSMSHEVTDCCHPASARVEWGYCHQKLTATDKDYRPKPPLYGKSERYAALINEQRYSSTYIGAA